MWTNWVEYSQSFNMILIPSRDFYLLSKLDETNEEASLLSSNYCNYSLSAGSISVLWEGNSESKFS